MAGIEEARPVLPIVQVTWEETATMANHAKEQPGAPTHHRQIRGLVQRLIGSGEEATKSAAAGQQRLDAAKVDKSLQSQEQFDLAASMASLHRAAKARTHR